MRTVNTWTTQDQDGAVWHAARWQLRRIGTMTTQDRDTNAWAVGFIITAAVLLFVLGGILAILGFAILLDNRVMEASDGYALAVSPTAQGWAYLLAGVVSTVAAIFLFMGKAWARILTLAIV